MEETSSRKINGLDTSPRSNLRKQPVLITIEGVYPQITGPEHICFGGGGEGWRLATSFWCSTIPLV